ncbi:MAG TPA: ATP-binding protein [Spirochaetota bacterium]|nr:ATP-binding protein [Spirochaetota bacterium]HOL56844.1 ATP-binding protein [Spirochaetota bacterium]HPP04405.1 ATP-binding protein [Spirochaetota bacterium]
MNICENENTITFELDNSGKILSISENIEKITGYLINSLKERFLWSIFLEDNKIDFERFKDYFCKKKEFIIRDIYSEDRYLKPVAYFRNNENFIFVFYNITEFKKENEKLKEEIRIKTEELTTINNELLEINSLLIKEIYDRKKIEERLSYNYSLLDSVNDAIIATSNDKHRTIVLWNKGAELIFGFKKEEVINKPFDNVLQFQFQKDEDRNKFLKEEFKGELIYLKNDSRIFLDANIISIKDKKNIITEWIGVYRNITYKKEFEIKEKEREEQLIKSEKLASLGILISGIAHEINNPNNYVMLNSKMLKKFCDEITPILDRYFSKKRDSTLLNMSYNEAKNNLKDLISGLIDGSTRIKNIVQSLKEFIQPDQGVWDQEIDVNNAVKSSIIILNNLIKKSTNNFFVEYDYSIPKIKGNLQQLEQVIINLLVNACQSLTSKDKMISVFTNFNKNSNCINITIKDEGKGIPQNILSKIIEPFFTTKYDEGGTGLGLSISYNIIRKFNGNISFSSELNKGTTVIVTIPV